MKANLILIAGLILIVSLVGPQYRKRYLLYRALPGSHQALSKTYPNAISVVARVESLRNSTKIYADISSLESTDVEVRWHLTNLEVVSGQLTQSLQIQTQPTQIELEVSELESQNGQLFLEVFRETEKGKLGTMQNIALKAPSSNSYHLNSKLISIGGGKILQ